MNQSEQSSRAGSSTSWWSPFAMTLSLAAVAILCAMLPAAGDWLEFDRSAILRGEVWRIFTGHWVHFGSSHLFWDLMMFVVLGCMCEQQSRSRFLTCFAASSIAISCGILVVLPDMHVYRGLSGIDTALFTLFACELLRQKWQEREMAFVAITASLLIGLLGKIGLELRGVTIFVDADASGFVPAPLAHVIGALVGITTAATSGGAAARLGYVSGTR